MRGEKPVCHIWEFLEIGFREAYFLFALVSVCTISQLIEMSLLCEMMASSGISHFNKCLCHVVVFSDEKPPDLTNHLSPESGSS